MPQEYEVKRTGPKENPFQVFPKGNDGSWPLSEHASISEAQRAITRYCGADVKRDTK